MVTLQGHQTHPWVFLSYDRMKRIQLTQGKYAKVDDRDFEKLNKYKWFARFSPHTRTFYATRSQKKGEKGPKQIQMHNEVMKCPKGKRVDHRWGETLDNRRSQLRICTKNENSLNRGLNRNSPTGFKGVSFSRTGKRFRARIQVNKKPYCVGTFHTAEEAARAYNRAAKKLHKQFARLNKV